MKHLTTIAGAVLGLLFLAAGLMVLLGLVPDSEPPPADSPIAHFFAAFGPTGYLTFVKVCEVVGGLLVAVPRTRNLGLLVLCPILVNILAFHVFGRGRRCRRPDAAHDLRADGMAARRRAHRVLGARAARPHEPLSRTRLS